MRLSLLALLSCLAGAALAGDGGGGNASGAGADEQQGEEEDAWWAEDDDDGGGGPLELPLFVPPPPRPYFLDDSAAPDGLTTCDLCSWAWEGRPPPGRPPDVQQEHPGKIGWALTLAIVSIASAAIGAIVMVTVLHCRKWRSSGGVEVATAGAAGAAGARAAGPGSRPPAPTPGQERGPEGPAKGARAAFEFGGNAGEGAAGGGGGRRGIRGRSRVLSWLSCRRSRAPPAPPQLSTPAPIAPAENHYTLDEAYAAVGEALYAELDRESTSSPAYQNTAYTGSDTEPDAPVSSAPSSAYYSDLSCAAYEAVGAATGVQPQVQPQVQHTHHPPPAWDSADAVLRRPPLPRLAAITETITVPSDYV